MHLLILNGPNLNRTGRRQTTIYGEVSFEDWLLQIQTQFPDHTLTLRQSNHEGQLIDWLQEAADTNTWNGVLLNPGALAHYGYALADALIDYPLPVIEIHLSNIHAREDIRHTTLTGVHCRGIICGLGLEGYRLGILAMAKQGGFKGTSINL
jgi:3-dehydroquinate dehydratase-2